MRYRIGFVMDQIAGHVTNYRNLRAVAERDTEIDATWHEIHYYKGGGALERLREGPLAFVPSYATGVLRGAWEVHKALRHRPCDALFSNASVGPLFNRRFRRVPTLIDFDSTPVQIDRMAGYDSPVDSKPLAALKWRLSRNLMRSATGLQAWSRWAKCSAVEDYGIPADKIVVNPPGVDLDRWRPLPLLHRPTAPRPLRVLFVGADFTRKGGELLLKWHQSLEPGAAELHIVTRAPVEPRPGVFVHHGVQPNSDQLIRHYQDSDLFVLPSFGESFGIATVEAMAAGLPVIASDVGGVADIIEPGRNGFIVPAGDLSALGKAVASVLGDADRRVAMGAQSRLMAKERFDLQTNARRTLEYLKQIARRASLA